MSDVMSQSSGPRLRWHMDMQTAGSPYSAAPLVSRPGRNGCKYAAAIPRIPSVRKSVRAPSGEGASLQRNWYGATAHVQIFLLFCHSCGPRVVGRACHGRAKMRRLAGEEGGADGRKGRAQRALDVLETWIVELRNVPQATTRERVEQKVCPDAPGLRGSWRNALRPAAAQCVCRRRPDRRAGQGHWYFPR
jgi:hypothetical protein